MGCILLTAINFQSMAQEMQSLPVDPQVKYGKLANGLTYYIRHNAQTKDRADFYIAQRVGSMQEEDSQAGLAHFLEHMAFNGTTNFPDKDLINYLERIGIRFGENLNAYTGFDETVYMIKDVPVTRPEVVDTCMLALYDWANGITLKGEEIDKERKVIHEEWRTRGNAQMRLWEKQFPVMYAGSKYADRLPIGKMEVVDHFKHNELRDYYKKWYRPDLQAIIIVGDIDADKVETDLKKLFGTIPTPVNPAKHELANVPDNEDPIVSIATDKEASQIILFLYFKHKVYPENLRNTSTALAKDYITQVSGLMINERFGEITQKPTAPFIYAAAEDGKFMVAKTKDAWTVVSVAKEGHIDESLATMARETERVKTFGFTASEYDRARINVLKRYESIYNERDKRKNNQYSQEYINHFTNGGYIPGIETEYGLMQQIAQSIPVDAVNKYVGEVITDKNIVIALTGPEKEGLVYPSKKELLETFVKAQQEELTAYKETFSNEPLVTNLPPAGKITSINTDQQFGTTVLTLSNGAKVIVKKTTFKADEINMTATAPGGKAAFSAKDFTNLKVFNEVVEVGGLGNFSATDLPKILAGKKVASTCTLGANERNINGTVAPKDLETLFQIMYLQFTAPRMDEEAFQSYISRMKSSLLNAERNPMYIFGDSILSVVYQNNPRQTRLTPQTLEQVDYARIMQMYKTCFTGAGDFVFSFVGNVDIATLKPLLEKYIAVLPAKSTLPISVDKSYISLYQGKKSVIFDRTMETPKATVANIWSGTMPYTLENNIRIMMLKQVLDIIYVEKVREEQGGTYGVGVSGSVTDFPSGLTMLQSSFDTDPAKQTELNKIVIAELNKIATTGPDLEAFNKTKENLLKKHAENLQDNRYWLAVLNSYFYKNLNIETPYQTLVEKMTPQDIKSFTHALIQQGNQVELVMEPKTAK